ncbi:type I restriction enzyme subunit R domain-containing protein [Lactobacillus iners]|jgi:type I site-specific deoxyribonuclease, hsdR family|uniref:type I restriction enzyme subunit R domain-containing protein n=1 Tax=Lactobacillus iners TaxID=147802 RepID=UPI0001E99260|nr:hypothetical protein [Lactobacillus iners]EFQ47731.1 hypothetical protein HMPREF9216_0491 [Lactobacillus iners LEAF 2053A-b]MDK7165605.1 hypothetical protein [Lactobacillus iners]MDK7317831.1 hypothetical protein [Lactobacillus iners]PMC41718.1 hypothetical protein CJ223_03825 [Lactobacillus iners]
MVDTKDEDIDDEMVWDINREKAMMAPQRIKLVTKYILEHFDQKTYRGDKTYIYNTLTNISQVASGKNGAVEEIKQKQRVSGFNSIFAVASVPMAKLYYQEFKKQMETDPTKKLRIATIYSYGANEAEYDEGSSGILDEENSEDTSALDSLQGISLRLLSKITMKCSILTTLQIATNSRTIIKTFPFV